MYCSRISSTACDSIGAMKRHHWNVHMTTSVVDSIRAFTVTVYYVFACNLNTAKSHTYTMTNIDSILGVTFGICSKRSRPRTPTESLLISNRSLYMYTPYSDSDQVDSLSSRYQQGAPCLKARSSFPRACHSGYGMHSLHKDRYRDHAHGTLQRCLAI